LSRKLPFTLSLAALLSGAVTYWALTQSAALSDKTSLVLPFIYLDIILLLLLAIVIAKRLIELWLERRRGSAGSKLHIHIVTLFSVVAVTPAIIVAVFSARFFDLGIEAWFGKPVKDALHEARVVSEAYLIEHQKAIKIDAHSLVNKLRPHVEVYLQDPALFSQVLSDEADERGLGELLVFNGKGQVIARSYLTFALELEKVLLDDFDKVQANEIVIRASKDRVRALIKLDPLTDTYLFVGKLIDPDVSLHLNRTQSAIQDYYALSQQHSGAQLTFVVFFSLIVLLLLLAAIWAGLTLANVLVKPISRLVAAAEAVSHGNLSVKVEEEFINNELDDLTRSFNRMTHRLQQQNQDLIISQRKAAWADVARRIAHEIKNPLTPIQLSAERLKRRYLKEIVNDPQTFKTCVDIIIRQVSHIGNLVNEFTSFARMPEPKFEKVDIIELAQQAIFLQKQAYPQINFIYNRPEKDILWICDPQQISQVLTNLLQNALNALSEIRQEINSQNTVLLSVQLINSQLIIQVEDNGPGFPQEQRERLIEPYYTTREKGTGLGLAIVSKIVSDHNGRLYLRDSQLGGACVQIVFNYADETTD
jgi:nitrogen fixation/metabolism regulation signal transduction histidine kinase